MPSRAAACKSCSSSHHVFFHYFLYVTAFSEYKIELFESWKTKTTVFVFQDSKSHIQCCKQSGAGGCCFWWLLAGKEGSPLNVWMHSTRTWKKFKSKQSQFVHWFSYFLYGSDNFLHMSDSDANKVCKCKWGVTVSAYFLIWCLSSSIEFSSSWVLLV